MQLQMHEGNGLASTISKVPEAPEPKLFAVGLNYFMTRWCQLWILDIYTLMIDWGEAVR
jgi:hypothetical protein